MFEGRDLIHADEAVHINIEEADLFQAILNTGDKLGAFHVADNNRMAPGMGDYDWVQLITTLKAAGYNDALTVEFVAPLDRTPANPFRYKHRLTLKTP
jgi:sugar phosphate isomerase/epimerase